MIVLRKGEDGQNLPMEGLVAPLNPASREFAGREAPGSAIGPPLSVLSRAPLGPPDTN